MAIEDIIPVRFQDEKLYILDQTMLPEHDDFYEVKNAEDLWDAIKRLAVRGAPAIGVAAGYGMYIHARDYACEHGIEDARDPDTIGTFLEEIDRTRDYLDSSRPTAVNLSWATELMAGTARQIRESAGGKNITCADIVKALGDKAEDIRKADYDSCYSLAENGLSLLKPGMGILTHCNAGILATAGYGTALAPLHLGQERGYGFKVFADETRPLLQGARLTSWELMKSGVDVTLICDNMASLVMKKGLIDAVVVGCDRMAANGDGANKIGTSAVAILAKEYGIPFYMFVPTSTIDMDTPTGDDIVIEEREGSEIYRMWYEHPMAPEGVKTFNPAFDVTDHRYITAVVTEKGVIRPPYDVSLKEIMGRK